MKKYERLDTAKFIERARLVHGERYDYSKVEYKGVKIKITVICTVCGHLWDILPNNHMRGRGCKICAYKKLPQNQPRTHEEFIKEAYAINGDAYDYLSKYISDKKQIELRCKKCGGVFSQRASSHLVGYGCKKCCYDLLPQNQPRAVDDYESRCRKIHEDKYKYCGDYKGGRYKIKILCKHHQEYFYQNAFAHLLKEQGCPKCNLSKGEIKIEKFLKQRQVNYVCGKKFPECRFKQPLPFDFYLPDLNLCIEYDGRLHYYAVQRFGGKSKLLYTQNNDAIKTKFCEDQGIDLLRIPFFEYPNVEWILEQKLGKVAGDA